MNDQPAILPYRYDPGEHRIKHEGHTFHAVICLGRRPERGPDGGGITGVRSRLLAG